jgi:hypothetical protein
MALDWWSHAGIAIAITAVIVTAIVSAAVTAKATAVFGFFIIIIIIVILRRSAKDVASCDRVLLG